MGMGPAQTIIAICGGNQAVAAWLGVDPSWVTRWTYPKERGGSDGFIPTKYHEPILLKAREEKKRLRPEHFFPNVFPQFATAAAVARAAANENTAQRRRKAGR